MELNTSSVTWIELSRDSSLSGWLMLLLFLLLWILSTNVQVGGDGDDADNADDVIASPESTASCC